MLKKEISEVKKQLTPDNCTLGKIITAYVSPEKELSLFDPKQFLSLPEEESFKYLEIFKAALSGKKGKSLYDADFPTLGEENEENQLFYRLKKNNLEEDDVQTFFLKIAENFVSPEGYLIILTRGAYDVPSKTTDNVENFDASDSVYEHIFCCICPVSLREPGLSLKLSEGKIKERIRDWCIEKPTNAFLYPAFNDRMEDIHSLLYFAKNANHMQEPFLKTMIGSEDAFRSGEEEKELFRNALDDSVTCESFLSFQQSASSLLSENEDFRVSPVELGDMLERHGAEETDSFIEKLDDVKDLALSSIVGGSKMSIDVSGVSLKVPMDQIYQMEIREIDGRTFFCLPVNENHVDVNGVSTKIR